MKQKKERPLKDLESRWGITWEALSPVETVENPPGFPSLLLISTSSLLVFPLSLLPVFLPRYSLLTVGHCCGFCFWLVTAQW